MRMVLKYRKAVVALLKAQGMPEYVKNSQAAKVGFQDDDLNQELLLEAKARFCTSIEAMTAKIAMAGTLELELELLYGCIKKVKKTIKDSSKAVKAYEEQEIEDVIFAQLNEGMPSMVIEQVATLKQGLPMLGNVFDEMIESGALMEQTLMEIKEELVPMKELNRQLANAFALVRCLANQETTPQIEGALYALAKKEKGADWMEQLNIWLTDEEPNLSGVGGSSPCRLQ